MQTDNKDQITEKNRVEIVVFTKYLRFFPIRRDLVMGNIHKSVRSTPLQYKNTEDCSAVSNS